MPARRKRHGGAKGKQKNKSKSRPPEGGPHHSVSSAYGDDPPEGGSATPSSPSLDQNTTDAHPEKNQPRHDDGQQQQQQPAAATTADEEALATANEALDASRFLEAAERFRAIINATAASSTTTTTTTSVVVAMAHGGLASALQMCGRLAESRYHHDQHIALAEQAGDAAEVVRAWVSLANWFFTGFLNSERGREGWACLQRAETLARDLTDHQELLRQVLTSRGNALVAAARYELARLVLLEAVNIPGIEHDDVAHGRVCGLLATAYTSLGDVANAEANIAVALTCSRRCGDKANEGRVLGVKGAHLHTLERFEECVPVLKQALRIAIQIQDVAGQIRCLGLVGSASLALQRYGRAAVYLRLALQLVVVMEDAATCGRLHGLYAQVALSVREPLQAIDHVNESLKLAKQCCDTRAAAKARYRLALACWQSRGACMNPPITELGQVVDAVCVQCHEAYEQLHTVLVVTPAHPPSLRAALVRQMASIRGLWEFVLMEVSRFGDAAIVSNHCRTRATRAVRIVRPVTTRGEGAAPVLADHAPVDAAAPVAEVEAVPDKDDEPSAAPESPAEEPTAEEPAAAATPFPDDADAVDVHVQPLPGLHQLCQTILTMDVVLLLYSVIDTTLFSPVAAAAAEAGATTLATLHVGADTLAAIGAEEADAAEPQLPQLHGAAEASGEVLLWAICPNAERTEANVTAARQRIPSVGRLLALLEACRLDGANGDRAFFRAVVLPDVILEAIREPCRNRRLLVAADGPLENMPFAQLPLPSGDIVRDVFPRVHLTRARPVQEREADEEVEGEVEEEGEEGHDPPAPGPIDD